VSQISRYWFVLLLALLKERMETTRLFLLINGIRVQVPASAPG
jgi:hypothetical protein